jgi:hypothetical protein
MQRVGQAVERARDAVQTEQLLNGARGGDRESRFLLFTLPLPGSTSPRRTMQLAIRERQPDRPPDSQTAELISIKLDLPRLGPLRVSLAVRDSAVSCRFSADSAFAAELIRAGSTDLAASLQALGFARASVEASATLPASSATSIPTVLANHQLEALA